MPRRITPDPSCSARSSGIVAAFVAASATCTGSSHAQCEIANLVGSGAGPNANLGVAVAIEGDTVLVGADLEEVVYAFGRDTGGVDNWGETGSLIVSDGSDTSRFGSFVSIVGDIAAVGAYWADIPGQPRAGAVWIFERIGGGQWVQMKQLTAPEPGFFYFYGVVAMDADTLLVGSPLDEVGGDAIGSVYVYRRNEGGRDNWGHVQRLTASDAGPGDRFGFSVELDGPIAVVGAIFDDGRAVDEGSAYVFTRTDKGDFQETAKLTAGDAAGDDLFGCTVTVAGDIIVVGAYNKEDEARERPGSAYVFEREGGAWPETAKLVASDAADRDRFGVGLAITEREMVLVGAPKPNNDDDPGTVYVFARDADAPGGWSELDRLASPNASGDSLFGGSIAVQGDLAVVGARADITSLHDSGSAFLFDLQRCLCPVDLDGSGDVAFGDLLALLFAWGACTDCPGDIDGNGEVDSLDLEALLVGWGPCP